MAYSELSLQIFDMITRIPKEVIINHFSKDQLTSMFFEIYGFNPRSSQTKASIYEDMCYARNSHERVLAFKIPGTWGNPI